MGIDYKKLGNQVRKIRKQYGYSQETLSEYCDISVSFLGHIERGTRKMSLETLVAISEALHTTPNTLLQDQLSVNNETIDSFLSNIKFDNDEQETNFYKCVKALIKGKDEL